MTRRSPAYPDRFTRTPSQASRSITRLAARALDTAGLASPLLLATTRARGFLRRVARGATITRITDQITVTASKRVAARTPDRRSTTSGVCQTRTRPPRPLDGRPTTANHRGGTRAAQARDSKRGDEV